MGHRLSISEHRSCIAERGCAGLVIEVGSAAVQLYCTSAQQQLHLPQMQSSLPSSYNSTTRHKSQYYGSNYEEAAVLAQRHHSAEKQTWELWNGGACLQTELHNERQVGSKEGRKGRRKEGKRKVLICSRYMWRPEGKQQYLDRYSVQTYGELHKEKQAQ